MKAKTLDQEVKGLNDGLVSMGVVKEAPDGNLPAKVEEPVEEISDGTEDGFHKELSYLCKLAGRDDGYITKIEDRLESLLDLHNFLEKKHYHKRIREEEGFVDYLFLKEFAGKPGTYGLTLDIDESEKFESLLSDYGTIVGNREEDNYGVIGGVLGIIPSFGVGIPVGVYSESAFDIGPLSILVGIVAFVAVIISSGIAGSYLGRFNLKNSEKKLHDAIQEYEQEGKVKSSQDKYDFGIIKYYLDLTPKWLLDKK